MTPAIRLLADRGIEHSIHEYRRSEELRDFGREAAESLGLPFDQVFKTLLVSVEGGDADERRPVVAVIPVDSMLSMKLVAAAVGAKKASMCDSGLAEKVTGYVVGGISPIGQRTDLPTVIDESAERFDTVYVSGGRRGLDIAIAPRDLVAVLDAVVAPITA